MNDFNNKDTMNSDKDINIEDINKLFSDDPELAAILKKNMTVPINPSQNNIAESSEQLTNSEITSIEKSISTAETLSQNNTGKTSNPLKKTELFSDDPELAAILQKTMSLSNNLSPESSNSLNYSSKKSETFSENTDLEAALKQTLFTTTNLSQNNADMLNNLSKNINSQEKEAISEKLTSPEQKLNEATIIEKEDIKPRTIFQRIMSIVSDIAVIVICLTLVIGSALFAFSDNPQKSYFGYRFYSVQSESMTPKENGSSPEGGFYKGDLILIKKVTDAESIKIGDIITFSVGQDLPEGFVTTGYLTHRVTDIIEGVNGSEQKYFITRGDHNDINDPPVSAKLLIGKKVATIPKLGYIIDFIRQNLIIVLILLVSVFVFVIALKIYFAKPKRPKKLFDATP